MLPQGSVSWTGFLSSRIRGTDSPRAGRRFDDRTGARQIKGSCEELLGKPLGVQRSPLDALARAISLEDQQAVHLVSIQILDRVVQALFGILVRFMRNRIVNTGRPAFFFQGS